jgi:DNA polymerase V
MYYEQPMGVSVHGGFSNPATDASLQGIDLGKLLVQNSAATFMMRIAGDEWQNLGVRAGDLALIDRALAPRATDLVVWLHEDQFVISPLPQLPEGGALWGVVTTVIHQYRSKS